MHKESQQSMPFNVLAIVSLVAALVSGLYNPYAIPAGVAVICGLCALPSILKKKTRGFFLAIVGIVFGGIGVALYAYVFYLTYGAYL